MLKLNKKSTGGLGEYLQISSLIFKGRMWNIMKLGAKIYDFLFQQDFYQT